MPLRLNPFAPVMPRTGDVAAEPQNNAPNVAPALVRQAPAGRQPGRIRTLAGCFGSQTELEPQNLATLAGIDRWRAAQYHGPDPHDFPYLVTYAEKAMQAVLRESFSPKSRLPFWSKSYIEVKPYEMHPDRRPLYCIAPELGQATRLRVLNLKHLHLKSFPPEMGRATGLHILILHGNQLTSFPGEMAQVKSLLRLYLFANRLTSFPVEMGQAKSLRELNLGFNRLTSFPAEMGQATALQILDLTSNQLTSFPAEMGQAKSLRELDLGSNRLTSFPAEMGQATALEKLYLPYNQLTDLPAEIARLPNLRHLYLRHNNFTRVPRALLEARAGAEIDLQYNPLPAEEIRAVRAAIAQRRAAGLPVPHLILPPIRFAAGDVAAPAGELVAPVDDLRDAVDNDMNVHTGVLTQAFKKRLDDLTKQFPGHLLGSAHEQRAQLKAIENRLTHTLHAHAHQPTLDAAAVPQARRMARLMFQKGLGERGAYVNEFDRSAGHVLAYTFLALEAQWARTPPAHLAEARRNGMTALIQALHNGSGMCDTRLCEEVMQTIGLPLTAYAQANADVVEIQPVQISNQESRDIIVEQAQQVLAELIHTYPSLHDDALRYNWRFALLEKMQTDHPKIPAELLDKEIEQIESAWEEFHDMVLENRLGILIQ